MLKICGIIHVSTVQDCSVGSLVFNKTVTAVSRRLTPNINSDWRGFERLSAERTAEWQRADLGEPLVASQQGKTPTQAPAMQMRTCGCTWQLVMDLLHQWYSMHPFLCSMTPCPSPLQPHCKYLLRFKREGCFPYYNHTNERTSSHTRAPLVISMCWNDWPNGELIYQLF